MITAGDFRNGVTFEMDGQVMQVVEFQHVKPGKGAAFVRTKMKNVITGAVTETSFNPTAKFENATVDRVSMEYSYQDGNLYYFMNPETYELEPVDESVLGDNFKFVKENMECTIYSYKGKVFNVEPPFFVDYRDGSGLCRQHRHERHEACHPGDRRRDQGPALHRTGREDQGRHTYGRVSLQSIRPEPTGARSMPQRRFAEDDHYGKSRLPERAGGRKGT